MNYFDTQISLPLRVQLSNISNYSLKSIQFKGWPEKHSFYWWCCYYLWTTFSHFSPCPRTILQFASLTKNKMGFPFTGKGIASDSHRRTNTCLTEAMIHCKRLACCCSSWSVGLALSTMGKLSAKKVEKVIIVQSEDRF